VRKKIEACLYNELFHPIFFNSQDRVDFIHAVVNFREKNFVVFDKYIYLQSPIYELEECFVKLSKSIFCKQLDFSPEDVDEAKIAKIPILIRNIYHHHRELYVDKEVLYLSLSYLR
jgi:hypothetical protein